ncbi:MAG TPA: PEGA domain-containing protein [Candidatus Saccharimonadales bacterium]|nr:PEGA domain-containing protein [Candidatus Saccharimonadales bacterium]
MYRQPSRRKQLIQRVLIYALMSVAVVALVVALLFVVLGYQLNRSDGRIEQGGLVQFDSQPAGANVTIDGVALGAQTAAKSTLNAGNHYFTMSKNGYKNWQKSVYLAPGSVLWLNYARLIPTELKPENIATFATVSSSIASPNAKLIALKEDPATPIIRLVDISRNNLTDIKTKDITIPQEALTVPEVGKGQALTLEAWDPTSRYLLAKHTYNDSTFEWLIIDTEAPERTKNITTILDVTMSKVIFHFGDSNILYVQTDNDVRRVDVNAATISRPLVSNIAEFALYDRSTILYTSLLDSATKTRSVGYYEDGAEKPFIVRSVSDDGTLPFHIAVGKFFNEPYIAINYGDTLEILHGSLPRSEKDTAKLTRETTISTPGGVQYVKIQNNGRFVVAQKEAELYVYDNELKKQSKITLKGEGAVTVPLKWLDNYMMWSNRGGMLRLYEFDGENQNDIMPVSSQSPVTLGPDETYLYAFTPGEGAMQHLTRVRLILP